MTSLVTGGTGFVGAHIVRALLRRGRRVRCLVRASSDRRNLEGLEVELAVGDLGDPGSLEAALRGVDTLFHCAADYRLFTRDPGEMARVNVLGTDNILRAADRAGVGRVVFTSSVGALGLRADGSPADETTPVARAHLIGPYKRTKFDAERIAESWVARGLPVVIVNPSTPVGELDVKPTPTGRIIVDFLSGRIPAYVDTGLNVIDVRDVAEGHLLAAEKGRVGEKYILGNRNLTLREILATLASLSGIPAPRVRLPYWVALLAGAADTAAARLGRREPRVPLEGVRLSRHRMFFDSAKAVRELGLPQGSVEEAFARAVEWYRANGYVGR